MGDLPGNPMAIPARSLSVTKHTEYVWVQGLGMGFTAHMPRMIIRV